MEKFRNKEFDLSPFQRDVPLFLNDKNRQPKYSDLDFKNILKTNLWLIEVQNWKEIDKEEITKRQVIKIYYKLKNNKKVSSSELKLFRAGITKFKGDNDFWQHNYDNLDTFQEDERVLIRSIYQIFKHDLEKRLKDKKINKKEAQKTQESLKKIKTIENIIYKKNDNKVFNITKKILLSEIKRDKHFDERASSELMENIWYMEKMNIPAKHQNFIFDFIHETELFYRSEERLIEDNRHNSNLKELGFNHLMRVQRFAWGIIDNAVQEENFAKFSPTEQTEIYKIRNNPLEMLKLSLISLGHDLLEDGKIKSADGLKNFIQNIAQKYLTNEEEINEIVESVSDSIDRLNSHNYLDENGERCTENYINGNPAKNIRPLNFMEKLIKIADISHNYQSKIKTEKKETKIKEYSKFISKNTNIIKLIPQWVISKFFDSNRELLENEELGVKDYWQIILELIDLEKLKQESSISNRSVLKIDYDYIKKTKLSYN